MLSLSSKTVSRSCSRFFCATFALIFLDTLWDNPDNVLVRLWFNLDFIVFSICKDPVPET